MIDVHTLRLTAAGRRLPSRLGRILFTAILLSFLLLGVVSSNDGKRVPLLTMLVFAAAFVAIVMIIVDLDRPQQGTVTVSQAALEDLLRLMTP